MIKPKVPKAAAPRAAQQKRRLAKLAAVRMAQRLRKLAKRPRQMGAGTLHPTRFQFARIRAFLKCVKKSAMWGDKDFRRNVVSAMEGEALEGMKNFGNRREYAQVAEVRQILRYQTKQLISGNAAQRLDAASIFLQLGKGFTVGEEQIRFVLHILETGKALPAITKALKKEPTVAVSKILLETLGTPILEYADQNAVRNAKIIVKEKYVGDSNPEISELAQQAIENLNFYIFPVA